MDNIALILAKRAHKDDAADSEKDPVDMLEMRLNCAQRLIDAVKDGKARAVLQALDDLAECQDEGEDDDSTSA